MSEKNLSLSSVNNIDKEARMLDEDLRNKLNSKVLELPELRKQLRILRRIKYTRPIIIGILYLSGLYFVCRPIISIIGENYFLAVVQILVLVIFFYTFELTPKNNKMGLLLKISGEDIEIEESVLVQNINHIYTLLRLNDKGKLDENSFYDLSLYLITRERKVKKYVPKNFK